MLPHRTKTRQIFDLMDGTLQGAVKERLLFHMRTCEQCATFYKQAKSLESVTKEAMRVRDPDWRDTDAKIDRELANILSEHRPAVSWLPFLLAAAATAAVMLSVLLPDLGGMREADSLSQRVRVLDVDRFSGIDVPVKVLETLGPNEPEIFRGAAYAAERVHIPDRCGARMAIGPDALLELGSRTNCSLFMLDEQTHAIDLSGGSLHASLPAGSSTLSMGFEILAGEVLVRVLYGVVDLIYRDGSLEMTVREGDVSAILAEGTVQLSPGTWRARQGRVERFEKPAPVVRSKGELGSQRDAMPRDIVEKMIQRDSGDPPKHLIREVFRQTRPKLRSCYEAALKRDPSLSLRIKTRILVESNGAVSSVYPGPLDGNPKLKECFIGAFKDLRFPTFAGEPLELIVPLHFQPEW